MSRPAPDYPLARPAASPSRICSFITPKWSAVKGFRQSTASPTGSWVSRGGLAACTFGADAKRTRPRQRRAYAAPNSWMVWYNATMFAVGVFGWIR